MSTSWGIHTSYYPICRYTLYIYMYYIYTYIYTVYIYIFNLYYNEHVIFIRDMFKTFSTFPLDHSKWITRSPSSSPCRGGASQPLNVALGWFSAVKRSPGEELRSEKGRLGFWTPKWKKHGATWANIDQRLGFRWCERKRRTRERVNLPSQTFNPTASIQEIVWVLRDQ